MEGIVIIPEVILNMELFKAYLEGFKEACESVGGAVNLVNDEFRCEIVDNIFEYEPEKEEKP